MDNAADSPLVYAKDNMRQNLAGRCCAGQRPQPPMFSIYLSLQIISNGRSMNESVTLVRFRTMERGFMMFGVPGTEAMNHGT